MGTRYKIVCVCNMYVCIYMLINMYVHTQICLTKNENLIYVFLACFFFNLQGSEYLMLNIDLNRFNWYKISWYLYIQ